MPRDGRLSGRRPVYDNGKPKKRMYAAAQNSRLSLSAMTSSADAELYTSLKGLRDKSRALVRDNPHAKRAKVVVVNNVIGQGVGMQGQVRASRNGRLIKRVNDAKEQAFRKWSRAAYCHTGGALHFHDLERLAMGEVFEAGECFIRLHPIAQGNSAVPLALELIESERVADDSEISAPPGTRVVMGVEVDDFDRALAYYFHKGHPRSLYTQRQRAPDEIIRVPADQVIHLRIIERWPQTRGVPAMHAAIGRLHQLGEFENSAVVAARIGASTVGFFQPTEWAEFDVAEGEDAAGNAETTIQAGSFKRLPPGYELKTFDPDYPHENFEPFVRAMHRSIAAAVGVSTESLTRDYSQSNYSSSRLGMLDDRDLWRTLQAWWIRTFREPLDAAWLARAVMSGAIPEIEKVAYAQDAARFEAVRFKPRGWSWVDPTKEVAAYKEAERAGYLTKGDVIAATGGGLDLEDVITARRAELDALAEAGLATDTTDAAEAGTPGESDALADAAVVDDDDDDDDQPDSAPARAIERWTA